MIGSRVGGRYEIIRSIGDGGMSKVYLAHDVILDRDVAIKVLNYDFAHEEELKRRFQREALSATSLTHPHIVDIFDVGEDGELHYLVMEYIEGQTLKQFIQTNGPLPPKQALPIMQQLVSAIANAHHNGIVHRDIKPQNILMDADYNVKITDFGIAMALNATAYTKTNSVIGTVHYLSPEQARGGMATKKSDIYSLGIVFYELLTGELPFSAETAVAIALKHLQEETPLVRAMFPEIPQSVENVILKATTKDAANRYRSADEMYDDLLTVLDPERAEEPKFAVPFDDDKTRAIPIVKDDVKFENVEATKKIEPVVVEPPATVKKRRKKWPIIAGAIVGVLALVLLVVIFLPGILSPKKEEIPEVAGVEETVAVEALEQEGFKVGKRIEELSDEFEAGQAIRTDPKAGTKRAVGFEVNLYISTGKETMQLENYTMRDYETVRNLLAPLEFKSIRPDQVFDDEPAGTILKQSHEAGEEVVPGDTDLIFTVSKGPETQRLGNLQGFDKKQWTDYAATLGIDIKVVREVYSPTIAKGHIISQVPLAGTEILKGDKVEVVISKGEENKPIKTSFKQVTIEYKEPAVPNVNDEDVEDEETEVDVEVEPPTSPPVRTPQVIQIYIQDRTHSIEKVFEQFTITETTQKQLKIELAEGQRGAYKVLRDGELIAQDSFNYGDLN
ncbi:Stk1 family PASTA domain-containing Ser/Thr kinase [Sporosarcina sp. FSL K6-1522]|uniref:Stk1 family PASTA domain-containing Ser/Thr kinase n=1 Tax=Sporosarcina sp. FSL K6-1522 TaxID=2921554 RepID=UPI00315A6F14